MEPWKRLSLVLFWLSIVLASAGWGQTIPRDVRLQLLEAVVQVIPFDTAAGEPAPWSGSGTIISPDGYILTNYHVIGDLDSRTHYEWHAILVTDPAFTDQPPAFRYWAQYVASDPTHDLAILRIREFSDETPVPAGTIFPSAAVGDSNAMLPGDPIVIVGYPGISGSTITFTSGTMSGWVGEDFETGGKQWIKTDAKIAHGNSGGAAFNLQGHLIGIPTAGRTIEYDVLDREEQAYVRPIGLAWAMIGPNVATVRRAVDSTAADTTPALPPAPVPPTQASGPEAGAPSGEYGEIGVGAPLSGRLAPAGEEGFTYHGYVVPIPPNTTRVVIAVDGQGSDVDLAVSNGAPITDYEVVEHLDTSAEPNPRYVIESPADMVYVDVLNLLPTPTGYTLVVTAEGGAEAVTPVVTPDIAAPFRTAGTVGALSLGQTATGQLEGSADAATYHTYYVDVPPGTPQVTVLMRSDADLDLAIKIGAEIDTYTDEGNWDYRDNTTGTEAAFAITNASGRVYIDVFNSLGAGAIGSYELEVR